MLMDAVTKTSELATLHHAQLSPSWGRLDAVCLSCTERHLPDAPKWRLATSCGENFFDSALLANTACASPKAALLIALTNCGSVCSTLQVYELTFCACKRVPERRILQKLPAVACGMTARSWRRAVVGVHLCCFRCWPVGRSVSLFAPLQAQRFCCGSSGRRNAGPVHTQQLL